MMTDTKKTNGRRDSKNYVSGWIRPEKRKRIYTRDDHTCVYCCHSIYDDPDMVLTLDHVVPRELGGGNEHTNLVTACRSCNSAKQDKRVGQFIETLVERHGVDPDEVAKRVRNARRRKLAK